MKNLLILAGILANLTTLHGAISVGSNGSGFIAFDALPPASDWSTTFYPGADSTINTVAELDTAVQGVAASAINAQLASGAGANPPTQNSSAVWTAAASGPSYVQTRPTGNAATALLATLRNDTGADATSIAISYALNQSAGNVTEQIAAHRVYISLTGGVNSWVPVPALSGGPVGLRSNVVVLPSPWASDALLYVLWVDDNATGGTDRGYQLDDVSFTASSADIPLTVVQTAPAGDLLLVAPADVLLEAIDSGTTAASQVSFYTNNVLFVTDTAPPYSNQLQNLPPGSYSIHAVALNAAETAFSRTNLVRVREPFVRYTGGTHTETFDGMGTNNGETPLGWYVGAALPATALFTTAGDGSAGAAGAILGWNYGGQGGSDRALGTAPTGGERNIVARIQNNTGSNIVSFELLYDGEVWRNYTNSAGGTLTCHVSFDLGSTWTPTTFDFLQPFPPAEPQQAFDGNAPANRTPDIGGNITPPAPLAPGSVLFVRWHDWNDPNVTDGGLAIDNFRFTALLQPFSSFVSLTRPTHEAVFPEAVPILIQATASMEHAISHVEFLLDDKPLGEDATEPYSITYSNSVPGPHTLSARAHDVQGATVTVASPTQIFVTSNLPPTLTITRPPDGTSYLVGDTVSNIVANASDPDGSIVRVDFYLDGMLWASDSTSPYSFDLGDITVGPRAITARAIDNANASASQTISLNATNPPGILVLVPNGAVWKFLDNGSDPGPAWRGLNFDDANWMLGAGELGYGDGPARPERTIVSFGSNPNAKFPTTYFRRIFNINNPAAISNSILRLLRDDRAIVYLNGNIVFNDITNAIVNHSTYTPPAAADDGAVYQTVQVPPTLLQQGLNILAVELHQDTPNSTDISFDLMLWAQGNQPGPPSPTSQPQSQSVALGSTVTFNVNVSGTPPFSYQWHFNCRNVPDGTNSGLTIDGVDLDDIGNYSVTIRNAFGQVTTWDAALTVSNATAPPMSIGRDKSSFLLRWPRRNVPYRLQALSQLENPGPTQAQPWLDSDWSVELTGQLMQAEGDFQNSSMFFRVASPSVSILRHPQGRSASIGERIALSVLATGSPPLSYQWRFNGSPLPGETNAVLTFDVAASRYGAYQVAVQDASDALLSSAAVLRPEGVQTHLSDNFSSRTLFAEPDGAIHGTTLGATREAGEPEHAGLPGGRSVWLAWRAPFTGVASFDTAGSGFDTLLAAYGPNNNPIAGDDDDASNLCSRIRFNVVANGVYNIALDGLAGSGGFFALNWSMLPTQGLALPVISEQPVDRIIASNQITTFSVAAADPGSGSQLSYQWYQNGVPVPENQGGTSPTLRVGGQAPSAPLVVGQYYVEVGNVFLTVRSRYASLQFSTDPQLRFVSKLLVDSICGFTSYGSDKSAERCCGAKGDVSSQASPHVMKTTKLLSAAAGSLTGSLTYGGTTPPVGSRAHWTWVTNGWNCLKLVSLSATVKVGSTHQPCTLVLIDGETGLLVKAADNGLSPNLTNINRAKAGKVYWIALGFDNPSSVGTLSYSFTGSCP